jgi:hypothetical protein
MAEKILNTEPIFIENLFKSKVKTIGQFGLAIDIVEKP